MAIFCADWRGFPLSVIHWSIVLVFVTVSDLKSISLPRRSVGILEDTRLR